MPIVLNKNHKLDTDGVTPRKCFKFGSDDLKLVDANTNTTFARIFRENFTFTFQMDESLKSEIIFTECASTGADVKNPANTSWSIINENGYLKVFIHEANQVNSLVYKSVNRIFNTLERKVYSLIWDNTTFELLLYINSLPESLILDTSNVNYRTNKNQFTSLNLVTPSVAGWFFQGGGLIFNSYPIKGGDFTTYYDSYINVKLTQAQLNTIYQDIQDTRLLPPTGTAKILVASDRGASGYDIYQVNSDFTDEILKSGLTPGDMFYPTWGKNLLKDEYIFIHQTKSKVLKESTGIQEMNVFLSTAQSAYTAFWDQGYTNFNSGLGLNDAIDTFGYSYGSLFTYATLDTNNKENSLYFVYGYTPLPFEPIIQMAYPYYFSASRKWVESHPINSDILLLSNRDGNGVNGIWEWNKTTNALGILIYGTSFIGNDNEIKHPRYNSNGTKIGFTANTSLGANPHAFICDIDGLNLIDLGANIEFCAFGNLASETDIIILFNRYEFSVTHNASFWRIYSRNLTTNLEVNLSGDVPYNDYSCDWKL